MIFYDAFCCLFSVEEMSHSREDQRHAESVGRGDDFVVADGAAGGDDIFYVGFVSGDHAVIEREKRIGCEDAFREDVPAVGFKVDVRLFRLIEELKVFAGLGDAEFFDGVDAVGLADAHADHHVTAGFIFLAESDRIGFQAFAGDHGKGCEVLLGIRERFFRHEIPFLENADVARLFKKAAVKVFV